MNNRYYSVRILISHNRITETTLETIHDYAIPYDKTWWTSECEFWEKSFDTENEARKFKAFYDNYKGDIVHLLSHKAFYNFSKGGFVTYGI